MPTQKTILSPSGFAWFQLGMKSLYDWQIECLESIGLQETSGKATSVVAGNGSGKTSNLVAPAVLWFLSRYPRGQVVVTSGSFRQEEKQLWPAMKVFQARFPSGTSCKPLGFIDTEEGRRFLTDPAIRERLAQAIARATLRHHGIRPSLKEPAPTLAVEQRLGSLHPELS